MDYRNRYEQEPISKSGEEAEEEEKRKAMCSHRSKITQTISLQGFADRYTDRDTLETWQQ